MTTDTTALQERIARAMWDHDNAHMSQQWRDMAWDDMGGSEPSDERIAYLLRATEYETGERPMTTLTPEDRARLRDLAGKATPGPWVRTGRDGRSYILPPATGAHLVDYAPIKQKCADAAYIAAADPATVTALLDALDAAEAAVERVREALFASDDGTEYEHDRDHGQAEGYPDCPGCWVETIRRALDGEVEA